MTVVIDASALVALIVSEPAGDRVSRKLSEWLTAGRTLHAPALARYEVANALTRQVAAGGLARRAVEAVLEHDQVTAGIIVSHWEDALDEWRQIDPPLDADAKRADERRVRDAETEETRTLVASAGNLIRTTFDQSLLAYAQKLGLECKIIEHHHLLTTQVAFTVTGPKRKIDEFAQGLKAESVATMRSEGLLALSPL